MNYILYGEETYLLELEKKRIIHKYSDTEEGIDCITYNASQTALQEILDDAMTIPLFSNKKVIIVDQANFLSANDDTNIDVSGLIQYFENPMESSVLIFTGTFAKLDARKKIVKLMQKCCKVLQFSTLDESSKESYIRSELQKRKIRMDMKTQQMLIEILPTDLRFINSELSKLELLDENVEEEMLRALIHKPLEEDVFVLVRAVVNKDIKKSFHVWNDFLIQNKDPIYLVALLASQFHFLYQVKGLLMQGYSKQEIANELKAHPYRVQMTMQSCMNLSISSILEILNELATLDQKLKNGMIDKKTGFELFLINLKGENTL